MSDAGPGNTLPTVAWDELPTESAGFADDDRHRRPPASSDDPDSATALGANPTLASSLSAVVDWLAERDRWRVLDERCLEDLYDGRWVTSEDLAAGVSAYAEMGGDPVRLNFAKNAVDFVQMKVARETPTVVASERGGGYPAERRAALVTQYIDRLIDSCDLEDLLPRAVLGALRIGTAVVKTFIRDGRPAVELVPSCWVHVDAVEAQTGFPKALYERRPVSRRWVLDTFVDGVGMPDDDRDPTDLERENAVRGAGSYVDPLDIGLTATNGPQVTDLITIYEGWSLDRHRHVVCVQGAVLVDEPWDCERFPHAFLMVDEPPPGRRFWAQGLLAHIDEVQSEIDFLLAQVSEQIRLSRMKVFVAVEDNVLKDDHLRNSGQGGLVRYMKSAGPPTYSTPPTVSREALEHIQWLVKELYEVSGMSEQSASSQKPAGINSGRGLLFFHDFQTQRFIELVRRYSRFVVDVVDRLLDRAEEVRAPVSDEEGGPDDSGEGGTSPATDDGLSWARVRMDRSEFTLRLESVSSVPRSYAGRVQRIEMLISQGQVPEGYWTEYLSDPMAWRAEHRAAAQAEHIEWLLRQLEDDDKDPPLSDKLDFSLAIEVLGGEVLGLIRKGADPDAVDRVEAFYDRIVARQKELKAQAAAESAQQQQTAAPALAGGQTAGPDPKALSMPQGGLNPTGQ